MRSWDSIADATNAWNAEDPGHTTYTSLQTFMRGKMRWDFLVTGDDQPGVDNACVTVENSHFQFLYSALFTSNTSKTLFTQNELDHYGNDGIDFASGNLTMSYNFIHDPLNLGDGAHQDGHQGQVSAAYPGPFSNVVIDHEQVLERLDASNPFPSSTTFAQFTGHVTYGRITNNVGEISNCPGIAFGGDHTLIANNTIVSNGAIGMNTCPQSGELSAAQGSDYNTWQNNVTAGRFYQACNHSVWRNNVQLPSRSAGKSIPEILSYCNNGKIAYTAKPGDYSGVTIYTTDLATFAFSSYNPPATWLSTTINLRPVTTGPLYRTGLVTAGVPTVNIGAY
jgi:hypothetical protein